jgi:hypothetical protein
MGTKIGDRDGVRLALLGLVFIGAQIAGMGLTVWALQRRIGRCPKGHQCLIVLVDTTAYHCLTNCGALEELDDRQPPTGSACGLDVSVDVCDTGTRADDALEKYMRDQVKEGKR